MPSLSVGTVLWNGHQSCCDCLWSLPFNIDCKLQKQLAAILTNLVLHEQHSIHLSSVVFLLPAELVSGAQCHASRLKMRLAQRHLPTSGKPCLPLGMPVGSTNHRKKSFSTHQLRHSPDAAPLYSAKTRQECRSHWPQFTPTQVVLVATVHKVVSTKGANLIL